MFSRKVLGNIQHCILIDGDFGRHELFSDVHPFTLDRYENEEQTTEFLNKTSDTHYHIYHNSAFTEIIEYYQVLKMFYPTNIFLHPSLDKTTSRYIDIIEIIKTYKYNYFWIIHGTENDCGELIKLLQSNQNTEARISHYSWLENLRNASNRIEYLFKYKMNDQKSIEPLQTLFSKQNEKVDKCDFDNRKTELETLHAIQPQRLNENHIDIELTRTDKPKDGATTIKPTFPCNFNGCKKVFATLDGLNAHQTAKNHVIDETNITTSTTMITEKPKDTTTATMKTTFPCNFNGCKKVFTTLDGLKSHQTAKKHLNEETNKLTSGIVIEEPDDIAATTITFDLSDYREAFTTSNSLENECINDESSSSISAEEKPVGKPLIKCDFDNCNKSFGKLRKLEKHQINSHSMPLRCFYTAECSNSDEFYLGKNSLENHIKSQHADLSSSLRCPVIPCNNKKSLKTFESKLNHVLRIHKPWLLKYEVPTSTKIAIPSWDTSGPFKCTDKNCEQFHWEEEPLKRHEAFEHRVAFQCPYGLECKQKATKYIGRWTLRQHIIKVHGPQYSEATCFDPSCQSEGKAQFQNWNKVLYHILEKHLDAVGLISRTSKKEKKKKCCYDNCIQIFGNRKSFLHHLIIDHPYPLRCPYKPDCNKAPFLGVNGLKRHIETDHSTQFTQPKCFHKKCQEEKDFPDWKKVLDHILETHFVDIKCN